MDSTEIWINRYINNGTSGTGSVGKLNIFKSEFLNSVVQKYKISSLIDLRYGQGVLLENLDVDSYLGFDVSTESVGLLRDKHSTDEKKNFNFQLLRQLHVN